MISRLHVFLQSFGIDFKKFVNSLRGVPWFYRNLNTIKKQITLSKGDFPITKLYPCLDDRFDKSGTLPLHYFYMDRHVAARIWENNPIKHVDIGSRVDGFIAHLSVFRQVEVFDIRPAVFMIPNVSFRQTDLMSRETLTENYCDSISSLHAIEHFGLGRYGDPVSINGHLDALNNITYLLQPGGKFYFATPIGPQRIEFDAHRVFSLRYLCELFQEQYKIDHFSYISDNNEFFEHVPLTDALIDSNANCTYGCGIFEMTRKHT